MSDTLRPDEDQSSSGPAIETLIANRKAKLAEQRELGCDPYPARARIEHEIPAINAGFEALDAEAIEVRAERVVTGGRVMAIRGQGKASFVDLLDGGERLQLHCKKNVLSEADWAKFKTLDLGDFVRVEGVLFRTRTGQLSVRVEALDPVSKSLRPLPAKHKGLTDPEKRARQRYLDLVANPESFEVFARRSKILSGIRRFLESKGFVEVETPVLQAIPGGATARPFATHHNALDLELFMRIAPELYLKRLIVGGFPKVFDLNRNFRNEGISTRHNPEFTMLEFYWAWADFELLMDLTEEMVCEVAEEACGSLQLPWGEETIDFSRPWRRMTVREAIFAYSDFTDADLASREAMEAAAEKVGVERIDERSDGKLLLEIFEMTAESKLLNPTFITHFPRDESPLAKSTPEDPEVVERFELFCGGMELANAYTELNDPVEQRRRFESQAAKTGGVVDEDFVLALEHGMPPTGGEGIGIDRLVMLLTNQQSIRDVILFRCSSSERDD